jgi:hypothetical protein
MNKSVILACEGVLFPRPLERIWQGVASAAGLDRVELVGAWENEAEDRFVRGLLPEEYLWDWIAERSGTDPDLWRETLWSSLYPLASCNFLARLSGLAEIHLLSEIRAEWLRPIIRSEGLLPVVGSLTFSSETGLRRPDLYALPDAGSSQVVVVDNHPSLPAVREIGYRPMAADQKMAWLQELVLELSGRGPQQYLVPAS